MRSLSRIVPFLASSGRSGSLIRLGLPTWLISATSRFGISSITSDHGAGWLHAMKYVETPELVELGNQLTRVVGDTQVTCSIELYTTKPASSDRRLIRALDQQLNDSGFVVESAVAGSYTHSTQLLSPPLTASDNQRQKSGGVSKRRAYSTPSAAFIGSPFGPLDEGGNMKQYAYLISVLNASDPDRDFSSLHPTNFQRQHGDSLVAINQTLVGLGLNSPQVLWSTIQSEITPSECKVYSLELPQQFLQDDDSGISWSKMFFFFNKRRKRVLFFYLNTRPAGYMDSSSSDSDHGVLGELE